jgi:predicted nucleotidyltransferase/HEPN domain-containing protein
MHAVKTLDDAMLTDMSHAIRSALPVRSIYLFGSRARGDARPDSDYDILVVTWDTRPDHAARLTLKRAVGSPDPPFDLRYVTAAEFEWRKRFPNTIERAADREGVLIHMADEADGLHAAAQRWLDEADMDFEFVEFAMLSRRRARRACFHAQQCIEKEMKAFLTVANVDALRTHALERLVEQCADIDETFAAWEPRLAPLSDYAVDARYPDGPNATYAEAEVAMSTTVEFRAFIRERIARQRGETE